MGSGRPEFNPRGCIGQRGRGGLVCRVGDREARVESVGKYLAELWSHRVVRIGAAYAAGGWALFQVAINVGQTLAMPAWLAKLILVLLMLGFPVALILAWASQARPAAPARRGAARTAGEAPSIAVLPFANFSREAADEVFADGMVEELITSLSMNPGLRVISRTSSFAYKNRSPDVREVGEALGAQFVLEGSVRRAGDRLRVTAQLIDTGSGGHLWAQKYDRPVAELFTLQDDLVWEIAAALHAEIDRAEVIQARRTTSVTAWEEAMRSTYLYERPRLAGLSASIQHARNAIEIEPQFALGHARLAMALSTAAQMLGEGPGGLNREAAVKHCRIAVGLAPDDPRVLSFACASLAHMGHAEEGLRHGLRSLELNPNDAYAHGSVGSALFRSGRPAEAFAYYDEEERLAPNSIWLNTRYLFRGLAHLALGRLDQACEMLMRSATGDPAFEQAWLALSAVQAIRGDMAAAVAAAQRVRDLNPDARVQTWTRAIAANIPEPMGTRAVEGFQAAWARTAAPNTRS